MPVETAGRLFVQLVKADTDRKRTDGITKRKAELALDKMEAGSVRPHIKDVLTQARARICS